MEAPARWVFVINQEFLELKSFLCVQMFDEARHVEVCRKRALVSGHGLGRASVAAEQALKELLSAETYPEASLATNLLLGSLSLAMYRALAALASHARRPPARHALRCRTWRARWRTAWATCATISSTSRRAQPMLNEYLDRTEHTVVGIAGSAEWLEPLIVLAAGSRERADLARGSAFARRWFAQTVARLPRALRGCGARRPAPAQPPARPREPTGGVSERAPARQRPSPSA